jgi:hypothetical protein
MREDILSQQGVPTMRAKWRGLSIMPPQNTDAKMKHPELRWNPELHEWFCVRCGLTSECTTREGAAAELNLAFECELPTISVSGEAEHD